MMHDCRKIEERLMDLVFDELSEDERQRTLAEIERCGRCQAEYEALSKTLSVFNEVSASLMPDEEFWNGYEARLQRKLAADEPLSWWQRWRASVKDSMMKPAWALSLAALLLLALLLWALVRQPVEKAPAPQNAHDQPAVIKPEEPKKENEQ